VASDLHGDMLGDFGHAHIAYRRPP
jgi:hypothetical protein